MDIHSARQLLRQKSIYEIPLRVTFYARVSSESDEQLNSLGNQVSYYEDFICKNPAWSFVPGYVDEGLSGISTRKRENFHRMVDDAKAGKFDLIITKEISRFARNTLDSISFTRELLAAGVAVFFQNDNINTLDEDSELRLAIMSSIAQDELRKLSSRVRFGHQQAIKDGVVLGNSAIFGYRKDKGRLVVEESEAKMVQELFQLYATGEYSMKQIEVIFWNKGYRNTRGNRLSHTTMSNMISNPKYKGYYAGNKVKVIDMFTKKQKFLPPEEWVMFKDETGEIVPALVSEELWDEANAVLQRRSADVKNRQNLCNHPNLLTGKLYCSCCGMPYYRRDSVDRQGKHNSKWVCSGKIKNGAESCPSIPLYEEELKPLLTEVFWDTRDSAEALVEEYTRMYKEMIGHDGGAKEMERIRKAIDLVNQKRSKLLGYNVAGQITDQDFLSMTADCNREQKTLEEQLAVLEEQAESTREFAKHMEAIRSTLKAAQEAIQTNAIGKPFVDKFIDRIIAVPEGNSVRLEIQIITGDKATKFLGKFANREPKELVSAGAGTTVHPGHMSKKMIEAYEQGMH